MTMQPGYVRGTGAKPISVARESHSFSGCSGNIVYYVPWKQVDRNNWPFAPADRPACIVESMESDNEGIYVVMSGSVDKIIRPERAKEPSRYWWIRLGNKLSGVMRTSKSWEFSDPSVPVPLFLSDPGRLASLDCLETCGYRVRMSKQPPKLPLRIEGVRIDNIGYSDAFTQVTMRYVEARDRDQVGPVSTRWWSTEVAEMYLPWWQVLKDKGIMPADGAIIRKAVYDRLMPQIGSKHLPIAWAAGNMKMHEATTSNRIIACFAAKDPRFRDPTKPAYITGEHGRMYYKTFPFYYNSKLHDNHKVWGMLFSNKPITYHQWNPGEKL